MLKWWRSFSRWNEGEGPPGRYQEGPFYGRWFRCQGPAATPGDVDYPTQTDGDGARLPGKFLNVVYDGSAADPVIVETIDDDREWYCYSPGGWIPRLVDVPVAYVSGLFVVTHVPNIPVRFDANVTAPNTVQVEIEDFGIADTQTFTAHIRRMAGTTAFVTNDDAFAWLNPKLKRWELINAEC